MIKEKVIYETRQHPILFWIKTSRSVFILLLISLFLAIFWDTLNGAIFFVVTVFVYIYLYYRLFWLNSKFYITNKRISLKVRNGLFSRFEMSLFFSQIKDLAYSKNNIFHFYFNYGTFFARSSGSEDDSGFTVKYMPNIEEVFDVVSRLYSMPQDRREMVDSISDIDKGIKGNKTEIIDSEIQNLLSIKGIVEAYELNAEDKKYIFEHEEDRNHGVYECLKREITLCVTHDSDFRDPDSVIVFRYGNKIIFPAVGFHEVKQKNTVSSSPGIEVHNYLVKKLKNYGVDDATLLIGFDI